MQSLQKCSPTSHKSWWTFNSAKRAATEWTHSHLISFHLCSHCGTIILWLSLVTTVAAKVLSHWIKAMSKVTPHHRVNMFESWVQCWKCLNVVNYLVLIIMFCWNNLFLTLFYHLANLLGEPKSLLSFYNQYLKVHQIRSLEVPYHV